jgi:copper chaperone CopZ
MEIQVENIKCNGCATSIKNALLKFDKVKAVNIEIETGIIKLDIEEEDADRKEILAKLQSMGYPEPGEGSLLTTATSYVSCMIGRVNS